MNIHNINTIARYEVKLLKRSWLFRIFAILALLFLTLAELGNLSAVFWKYSDIWNYNAVTSLIPFFVTYLYTIAQSVIVIFLAGNFLKRDKKLDTAEVIYVRPMSNADYIIGKVWGITRVFVGLNLLVLVIGMVINLILNQSPFSLFPYFFYLFTISLPALWFILGLSFTVMCILKNQAVTFIVMLGIVATIFFYLQDYSYGLLDFLGINIPSIFSDETGHANLGLFLLQRSIYFLSGIGFICLTIALVKRLPHRPWKTAVIAVFAVVLILGGVLAGWSYTLHFKQVAAERKGFLEVYDKYAAAPKASVTTNELSITQEGNRLKGESRLKIRNVHSDLLENIVLYLNPSLEVISVESEGVAIPFKREKQVIVLEKQLPRGEEWEVSLTYEGGINENICYTDLEDKEVLSNPSGNTFYYRYGKRYAYLEPAFTLLTPECVWYPVCESPLFPSRPYNIRKDFTRYALTVKGANGRTVLSQGKRAEEGGQVRFINENALPGISLTIADYENRKITVDSTDYELYYFKGHDFFSKHFNEISDTLPSVIRDIRNKLEVEKNRTYPFSKFVLAEAPVSFTGYIRNWKGYTEQVMPEIVFVPERGLTTPADFRAQYYRLKDWGRDKTATDQDRQIEMLKNYITNAFVQEISPEMRWASSPEINKLNIGALFFGFTGFIYSPDYPIVDATFNIMQNTEQSGEQMRIWITELTDQQRASIYLRENSFETAIGDREIKPQVFYEILKLKSNYLKNYILAKVPAEDFKAVLKEFNETSLFREVSFADFAALLSKRTGIDLMELMPVWYEQDKPAFLHLKDVDVNKVVVEDFTRYQIRFKAYNESDIDGVVTVKVKNAGRGGGYGFWGGGPAEKDDNIQNYIIPAHTACQIKLINDERPVRVRFDMNVAYNLPSEFTYNFSKVDNEISDTTSGSVFVDTLLFAPDPREIVVDNESEGFRLVETSQKRKLKDLFKKKKEDKYELYRPFRFPSRWKTVIRNTCYGNPVNSAVYKKRGVGNNEAIWTAQIPHDNYYEVFVWNPKFDSWEGRRERYRSEKLQTYIIKTGEEESTASLDMNQGESGWVSLGSFYFTQGEASVRLSDKVGGDMVVADAIKFVLLKKR